MLNNVQHIDHITPHHITPHDITSHHIISHHIYIYIHTYTYIYLFNYVYTFLYIHIYIYIHKYSSFISNGHCSSLSPGGANASALFEASRTCGAVGEWKRRVAEELSAVYFVGGWEAPRAGDLRGTMGTYGNIWTSMVNGLAFSGRSETSETSETSGMFHDFPMVSMGFSVVNVPLNQWKWDKTNGMERDPGSLWMFDMGWRWDEDGSSHDSIQTDIWVTGITYIQ